MLLATIRAEIEKVLREFGVANVDYSVTFTEHDTFGHVTTNVAMVLAKQLNKNPKSIAQDIADNVDKKLFTKIEVAGAGFVNFTLADEVIRKHSSISTDEIVKGIQDSFPLANKTVLVEYTDPNPFKIFHIGHLMTNIIGEAIAGIHEVAGAKVKRINYQGDVGRHIAITIWAILQPENKTTFDTLVADVTIPIKEKVEWLGRMYAYGYKIFINDVETKASDEIVVNAVTAINRQIYEKTDEEINNVYTIGREWSLEYFETLYKMLGTKFDSYFFESVAAPIGMRIVEDNLTPAGKAVFERGDGSAIIYNADSDAEAKLHTRVFVNSAGLPTYETKDLGNMHLKLEAFPEADKSIVITGNEQDDYFKVLFRVLGLLYPETGNRLTHFHYGHGMMRFADGKMSSRKGNIIAGDEMIDMAKEVVHAKFAESRITDTEEKEKVIEQVSIAAIKYSVLKQAIGKDIIFDFEKAISTEGDSGPYLQYTYARLSAVARQSLVSITVTDKNRSLLFTLSQYADVLYEVVHDVAPQKLLTYLVQLARSANSWYGSDRIQGSTENEYLAHTIKEVLEHGLSVLAIATPERM